jgi:hypothetical protein
MIEMKSKYILFLTILFVSCASQKKLSDSTVQTEYYPTDVNWSDTLANSSQQVKNAFMKFIFNDLNYINSQFKLSLTKEDFNNFKVLSVETYRIDSIDFENLNENSSINKILKLVKTEAECFMLKDSDIILNMEQKLEKGQWRVTNLGRVFDKVANQLKSLYFNENIKVHGIIVGNNKKYSYKKKFIVFVRNGKYMSIEYGKEVPLLQDLLDYKKNLESGLIF